MSNALAALGLTLFAGMATAIGSAIAFATKRTNYRFLSLATGFSAGVMLYVSFVEILPKGIDAMGERFGESGASWIGVASFFGGLLLIGLIDFLVPAAENPHETHSEAETLPLHEPSAPEPDFEALAKLEDVPLGAHDHRANPRLMRMGLLTALAIGIHNFPEGLATFLAALHDPSLGVAIGVAIALHNIPEGVSVSVPIYYATGSRKKAFVYSALSGLSEPVAAIIAYAAMRLFLGASASVVPPEVMGVLFCLVAGIMVYISLDQLLPMSRAYGKGHDSLFGLVAGMLVMALSLLLMQ